MSMYANFYLTKKIKIIIKLPVVFEGAGDCSGAIEVLKSSSSESSIIPSESVSSAGLEGLALVGP